MKHLKYILVIISFFSLVALTTSCGNKNKATTEQTKTGKEYTSAYICPMHCDGSGSDEAGTCPVCGMDYVKNEDHEGHSH